MKRNNILAPMGEFPLLVVISKIVTLLSLCFQISLEKVIFSICTRAKYMERGVIYIK